jgi:FlaA1/EpsC-like NDP-sugar epimerase
VFVPKLRAYGLQELIEAFKELSGRHVSIVRTGERPGEKLHEVLINEHEMRLAFYDGTDYVILPDTNFWATFGLQYDMHKMTSLNDSKKPYSSADAEKMTARELRELLARELVLDT